MSSCLFVCKNVVLLSCNAGGKQISIFMWTINYSIQFNSIQYNFICCVRLCNTNTRGFIF